MDFETAVNAIKNFFEGDYFCIGNVVESALVKGEEQGPFECFDQVTVDQGGGGITGDDFHGTAYFHIGNGRWASVEY